MKSALASFQTLPLKDAARQLLAKLGYQSEGFLVGAGSRPQDFPTDFASGHAFDTATPPPSNHYRAAVVPTRCPAFRLSG